MFLFIPMEIHTSLYGSGFFMLYKLLIMRVRLDLLKETWTIVLDNEEVKFCTTAKFCVVMRCFHFT